MVASLHLMPLFTFDSISSYKYPSGPRKKETEQLRLDIVPEGSDPDFTEPRITQIRSGPSESKPETRFDTTTLGFLTRNQHNDMVGEDLNCSCFVCRNLDINQFYEMYGKQSEKPSRKRLRTYLSIHEVIASCREFEYAQNQIIEDGYVKYLLTKEVIRRFEERIPEMSIQTSIDDF
ncbi:MAG: hypothetical protein ACFFE2_12060 [Candidatus Thorarchaeota archaeon]